MRSVWITPAKIAGRSCLYRFEKTVEVSKDAEIVLNISADTRYRFSVNGRYVCEGPCQGDHYSWKYETVTVPRSFLRNGSNRFVFDVLHLVGDVFYTQARKERPGLLVFGMIKDGGKEDFFGTDTTWDCFIDSGKYFVREEINYVSLPPVERHMPGRLARVKCEVYAENNIEGDGYTPYGLADKYPLEKRIISLLAPGKKTAFGEVKRGEGFSELDAGVYTTAYPEFVFRGEKGGKIKFIYAESYCENGDRRKKGRRDVAEGTIVGFCDEITLTGGRQTFVPYFYRAFRYVRAEFPEGTEFLPEKQNYRPYFYPIEEKGYVKTSDERINRIWDISLNTVRCCTHESFVDCPHYEQCQYDMDSALEMMFMFRVTDDYSMGKKAVLDLARSQRPDGMLCAHYPASFVQVIPTFSLYWIMMLKDYVTYTGDIGMAKDMLPTAEKIIAAFDKLRNEDGLVGATRYWHYTDWVPGWERGVPPGGTDHPLTLSSMMFSAALGDAAYLYGLVGRDGAEADLLKLREEVNAAVNKYCYDEKERFYVDVPGVGGFSEHTAVWAILSDAVTGEKAGELIDRSFAGNYNRASFSFNYYTFRALEKSGRYKEYASRLFEGWYKMLGLGCTTWCENPDSPRSECHGWSSAPIYEYSAVMAGVRPTAPGFSEVLIDPDYSFSDEVDVGVPTPKGLIKLGWSKNDGNIGFRVRLPENVNAVCVLPGGRRVDLKGSGSTRYFRIDSVVELHN